MRLRHCVLLAFVVLALLARATSAWWTEGHHCIDKAAALVLPAEMPQFFREGADAIASYSMDPDLWKDRKLPALRRAEYSNHYLDLELLEGRDPPATRQEFLTLCRQLKVDADTVGTLPYAIREWHDRLVLAFAEHRRWPDDKAIQAKVLYIAGVLSHYTGDASQPLHCTVHYDGQVGPDGSSPRTGIHLKMDALPGQLGIKPEEAAEGLKVEAAQDVFATAMAVIRESNKRVETVYRLQDKLPPAEGLVQGEPDEDVRALARESCRAGAQLTAKLWYSAWVASTEMELPEWLRPHAVRAGRAD